METRTAHEDVSVTPFNAPVLLGADGRPARLPMDAKCPRCGAGCDQRVASSGFGEAHAICKACAFEFED